MGTIGQAHPPCPGTVLWALFAAMKVKWNESVSRSVLSDCDPMDWSSPGFSVHGNLQERILEWVAMPSSRGSSQPRDWTPIFWMQADSLPSAWLTRWSLCLCVYFQDKNTKGRNYLSLYGMYTPQTQEGWGTSISRSFQHSSTTQWTFLQIGNISDARQPKIFKKLKILQIFTALIYVCSHMCI